MDFYCLFHAVWASLWVALVFCLVRSFKIKNLSKSKDRWSTLVLVLLVAHIILLMTRSGDLFSLQVREALPVNYAGVWK